MDFSNTRCICDSIREAKNLDRKEAIGRPKPRRVCDFLRRQNGEFVISSEKQKSNCIILLGVQATLLLINASRQL